MENLPSNLKQYERPNIKERMPWLDCIKGLMMILVMLSHMNVPMQVKIAFEPFFLSLFFVVSGYTFNVKDSFTVFLTNKIRTLVIPAFGLALIQIAASSILTFNEQEPIQKQLIELIVQNGGQGSKMWFVFALFMCCVCFYVLVKYIKNTIIFISGSVGGLIIGLVYNYSGGQSLSWHIHLVGIGCFWMALGFIWRIYNQYNVDAECNRVRIINWIMITCCVGYIALIIVHCYEWREWLVSFRVFDAPIWLYLMESFLGTIMMFYFLKNRSTIRFVELIGQNTLVFFAFHGKVQRIGEVMLTRLHVVNAIQIPIILITQCVVLIVVSYVIDKWFPFLVGKRYEKNS